MPKKRAAGEAPALQLLIAIILMLGRANAAEFDSAARSTNDLGVDLYRKVAAGEGNVCLSPYSINAALAMTLAGADGETRAEMSRVMHLDLTTDPDPSFAALQKALDEIMAKTMEMAEHAPGGARAPVIISIANRLFAQRDYEFRAEFLEGVKKNYGAPVDLLDFKRDAAGATRQINDWVAKQTRDRIRDLIPPGALGAMTRLVLANAIYLKAPWAEQFKASATKPVPFHVRRDASVDVAMMRKRERLRYAKRDDFAAIALPYSGDDLQFLILLPDKIDGLGALEEKLSANMLSAGAKMEEANVDLILPKFKFEPPTIQLSRQLQSLGMKSAFDLPNGSANFERMAPRKGDDHLAISDVFHKTFISVDENGTEAAAATAVGMVATSIAVEQEKPIEIKVDRPFLFAIQHVPSGACLFIGRVVDPR